LGGSGRGGYPEHHGRIVGGKLVPSHAIRHPLFLLTIELPRTMMLELSERSKALPVDLRRRWTYAAAGGACTDLSSEF
jgi:hypothetical protein